jgi:hypothetical protein
MEKPKRDSQEIGIAITGLDIKVEEMHRQFIRYKGEDLKVMPDWRRLERELIEFSRKKIISPALTAQLDRVLHKFQNRKKIWLAWAEEIQRSY